mgnify:CR=1 FL=1
MVNIDDFGESSVDFFVYTFTATTNWAEFHRIKEDVLVQIARIVEEHGAEIAVPARVVEIGGYPPSLSPDASRNERNAEERK